MKIQTREPEIRRTVHRKCGTYIQEDRLADTVREIRTKLMGDAGAAIVAADEKRARDVQPVHHGDAVPRHAALGVVLDVRWFGGLAVPADVDEDDMVGAGQVGSDAVPDVVGLGEAVEEKEGWERSGGGGGVALKTGNGYLGVFGMGPDAEWLEVGEHGGDSWVKGVDRAW